MNIGRSHRNMNEEIKDTDGRESMIQMMVWLYGDTETHVFKKGRNQITDNYIILVLGALFKHSGLLQFKFFFSFSLFIHAFLSFLNRAGCGSSPPSPSPPPPASPLPQHPPPPTPPWWMVKPNLKPYKGNMKALNSHGHNKAGSSTRGLNTVHLLCYIAEMGTRVFLR